MSVIIFPYFILSLSLSPLSFFLTFFLSVTMTYLKVRHTDILVIYGLLAGGLSCTYILKRQYHPEHYSKFMVCTYVTRLRHAIVINILKTLSAILIPKVEWYPVILNGAQWLFSLNYTVVAIKYDDIATVGK